MSRALSTLVCALLCLGAPSAVAAQRADSAAVAAKPAPKAVERQFTDSTVPRPPISPRRAFLYSLAVPGLGQSKLDRANAGALYVTVEAISLAMIGKTRRALQAAESAQDSVIVGYKDPVKAGDPPVPVREMSQLGLRARSRRTQVEDWMAVLIFNHFFSGADAFVAAQLWDLPTVLSAGPSDRGATLSLRVAW